MNQLEVPLRSETYRGGAPCIFRTLEPERSALQRAKFTSFRVRLVRNQPFGGHRHFGGPQAGSSLLTAQSFQFFNGGSRSDVLQEESDVNVFGEPFDQVKTLESEVPPLKGRRRAPAPVD